MERAARFSILCAICAFMGALSVLVVPVSGLAQSQLEKRIYIV
jgi:hypothetical protein